jgi:glycosyltransferase involved in cell wall biosynthesis
MSSRVVFLTPALGKGGAETQLIKLARFLKSQNIDVLIISLKEINDFPDDLRKEGIDVVFLKNNWISNFISNTSSLVKTIKTYKPDIVIAFMFIAIIIGRFLKQFFPFKLVSTIRAARIDRKWAAIFKITSGWDDHLVYNSCASKTVFESQKLVKKEGVVIRNAISIPQDNPGNFSPHVPFRWICMAHFRVDKDYPTVFKAISLLKDRNFKVEIIGHLYNLKWPMQTILELGIQNHVSLLGFKPDSAHFLKQSDALIMSSSSEGMPNAVLEALAYSKPVVGSDIDSVAEILGDSKGGVLFKTGNSEDLAEKMTLIMDLQKEDIEKMGMAGRELIKLTYEENIVFNNWLKLIKPYLKPDQGLVNQEIQ